MNKRIFILLLSLAFLLSVPYLVELRFPSDDDLFKNIEKTPSVLRLMEILELKLKDFQNLTVANGLASDQTRDVYVDSNFYIYVATVDGLSVSKDKGKTFKTYTTQNGLPTNKISSVVVNDLGHIFLGTHEGFSISTDDGNSFKTISSRNLSRYDYYEDSLAHNDINRLFLHQSGKVYIATSGGLSIYHPVSKTIKSYYQNDGLPDKLITDVFVDENNTIYLATWAGLAISQDEGKSYQVFTEKEGLISKYMRGVFVADGQIFCSTIKGLSISNDLSAQSFKNITQEQYNLPEIYVTKTYKYDGQIYLLTLGGGLAVSEDEGKTFKAYQIPEGLGSNRLYSLYYLNPSKYYVATWKGLSIKLFKMKTKK